MTSKKFDIVVYGATGFTGRLVAEYLSQTYGNGDTVSWAMAGRSQGKLAAVRDEIGAPADTPLVVADSNDPASVAAMVENTRLVLTTVGPYLLYGSEIVAACAKAGTDYVDLCGEAIWIRQMIDAHEETAKQSGARIVFSCGFDSIPSDLGIFRLQQIAKAQTGSCCTQVQGRVRGMQGTFSGGTAASFKEIMIAAKQDPEVYALAMNDYALIPGYKGVTQPDGNTVRYQEDLNTWLTPFVMAAINTRNVHRSNYLLGYEYGEDFVYDEMVMTGPGEKGEEAANFMANNSSMGGKDGPKPGEGPSKEEREAGSYDILYLGRANDGSVIKVAVKGDRDPGYGSTCKMLSESAICLIQEATDTPGGMWTTASAMGDKLITRLEANAGVTFTQE